MKKFLTVASKVSYWVCVIYAFLTVIGALVALLFQADLTRSPELLVMAIITLVLFLLGKALSELSGMHGELDQKDLLEKIANMASRVSDRARAAANKEDEGAKQTEESEKKATA